MYFCDDRMTFLRTGILMMTTGDHGGITYIKTATCSLYQKQGDNAGDMEQSVITLYQEVLNRGIRGRITFILF